MPSDGSSEAINYILFAKVEDDSKMSHAFTGMEILADLYGCNTEKLNNPPFLRRILKEATRTARMTLIRTIVIPFSPQGVDAIAILAESSIVLHSWPETGSCFVNLFTCGREGAPLLGLRGIAVSLECEKFNYVLIARGEAAKKGAIQVSEAKSTRVSN